MTKKILLQAPVTSFGGYAANGRTWADSLHLLGNDIKILNFDDYKAGYTPTEAQAWYLDNFYDPTGEWEPDVILNANNPVGFHPTVYPQMCNTAWETDKLPENMGSKLHTQRVVTVQSSFNVPAFEKWHDNVKVVPLGVDCNTFRPAYNDHDVFTFLAHGKWEYRKNFVNLVKTFCEEFEGNRKVRLLIKSHGFQVGDAEIMDIVGRTNRNRATVLVNLMNLPDTEIVKMYQMADCFVLPTRGEGFGVPFLESLACGVPCIAPDKGGHTDFVTSKNSLLVKSEPASIIPHSVYSADMKMIEPNYKSLAAQLRYAFDNRGEMKERGIQGRNDVLNGFDLPVVGKKMQAVLEEFF